MILRKAKKALKGRNPFNVLCFSCALSGLVPELPFKGALPLVDALAPLGPYFTILK
jgi:hypothetical protein